LPDGGEKGRFHFVFSKTGLTGRPRGKLNRGRREKAGMHDEELGEGKGGGKRKKQRVTWFQAGMLKNSTKKKEEYL